MIRNGNFTEGWTDMPPAPGYLINQQPMGWTLKWLQPGEKLFGDAGVEVKGVPECVHKLSTQLPPHEQLDAPNALILAGDVTYKIFNANAPFGASLSQTISGLEPGSSVTVTAPVQAHLNGETDPYGAESGVWLNGEGHWVHGHAMGNRQWYRHVAEAIVPENGRVEVVIRVKSKWASPKDFFIDHITMEAVAAIAPPPPVTDDVDVPVADPIPPVISEPVEPVAPAEPITSEDSTQRVLGIDVSYAQARSVNFKRAAKLGAAYCFIRAGSGRTAVDSNYDHNYEEAGKAGMLRGIYYYLYPEKEANVGTEDDRTLEGQARRFAAMLKPDAELGAVLDVEAKGLSPDDVRRFVNEFQKHDPYDRPIMIYTGPGYWSAWHGYTGSAVAWAAKHPLWIAQYTSMKEMIKPGDAYRVTMPDPWKAYVFHQWTAVGGSLVHHASDSLDLNYFKGSLADLKAWAGGTVKPTVDVPPAFKYVNAQYGLNLRNKPSTQGTIIKLMSYGESVEVLEDGDWVLLKSGDDTGYASCDYLSAENPMN